MRSKSRVSGYLFVGQSVGSPGDVRTPLAALQAQVEAWAQAVGATAAQAHPEHVYMENSRIAPADIEKSAITLEASQVFKLRHPLHPPQR